MTIEEHVIAVNEYFIAISKSASHPPCDSAAEHVIEQKCEQL